MTACAHSVWSVILTVISDNGTVTYAIGLALSTECGKKRPRQTNIVIFSTVQYFYKIFRDYS